MTTKCKCESGAVQCNLCGQIHETGPDRLHELAEDVMEAQLAASKAMSHDSMKAYFEAYDAWHSEYERTRKKPVQ